MNFTKAVIIEIMLSNLSREQCACIDDYKHLCLLFTHTQDVYFDNTPAVPNFCYKLPKQNKQQKR